MAGTTSRTSGQADRRTDESSGATPLLPDHKGETVTPFAVTVIGTRPEAIKLAPVVHALAERQMEQVVVAVGQHTDLLADHMSELGISADVQIDLGEDRYHPGTLTGSALWRLTKLLTENPKPEWIVLEGDTSTALASALAGFYTGTKVAYVESGMRSGNRLRPFPEEGNRQCIARLADIHFCWTKRQRQTLLNEGINAPIYVTGSTSLDSLRAALAVGGDRRPREEPYVLVTMHRRESFGEPLLNMVRALHILAVKRRDLLWIWPVHPNPNVTQAAALIDLPNVVRIRPLDYRTNVVHMAHAELILTDSGGIQEEAPALGVHTMVLRRETDRPEAVDHGWATLVGTDTETIIAETLKRLDLPPRRPEPVYGDGFSGGRIVQHLLAHRVGTP